MAKVMLKAALAYRELGYSVIPVLKNKIPPKNLKWQEFQKRIATEEEVIVWWESWPDANIAIVTGALSNLTVIDCDSQAAIDAIEEILPEQFTTPMQSTPRGGRHYMYQYAEGIRNRAGVMQHVDVRSEGGYILVDPSSNGNGILYSFLDGFSLLQMRPSVLPENCIKVFKSYSYSYSLCTAVDKNTDSPSLQFFMDGRRDEDVFHLANCLEKGRAGAEFSEKVLEIIAKNCIPVYPETEIKNKIKSAMERAKRREGTLTDEVTEFVMSTNGDFLSTDVHRFLDLSTRVHKKTVSTIMARLVNSGAIEKSGHKNGCWRKIDRSFAEQCWWETDGKPLPLRFPLGVGELARIYAGNLMLLEGQKSQGKSAFALEFVRLNAHLFSSKPLYQNVEMSNDEFSERFTAYGDVMTPEQWRRAITIIRQTGNWWDKILPDGLNIVDYLIEYKESYLIADFIWKIHQKLKTGIALILVQRDPFKPYPVGGRGVRDIPRLIMSLIKHRLKLEDVKSFYPSEYGNPTGLVRKYKQVNWWNFKGDGLWHHEDEEKYSEFKGGGK